MTFFNKRGLRGQVILFFLAIGLLLAPLFGCSGPPARVRTRPITGCDFILHPANSKFPAVVLPCPSRAILKLLVQLSQPDTNFPSEQAWDKAIIILSEEGGEILIDEGMEEKPREQLNRAFITESAFLCVEGHKPCGYYGEYIRGVREVRFWVDFFADGKLLIIPGNQYIATL